MAEILADDANLISAQILSIEPQDQHQPIAVACTTGKCTGGASGKYQAEVRHLSHA